MPTIKQKKAFKEVLNGSTITKAMTKAGYADTTASTTGKLTNTNGWQELMKKHLPDSSLAKTHRDLLTQKRIDYFVFPKSMEDEDIVEHVASVGIKVITVRQTEKGKMAFYSLDDANAIKGALDMAYKLKGLYAPEKSVALHLTQAIENREEIERIAENAAKQILDAETTTKTNG